ncbi:hypothetical protein RRG08_062440 [Elysia crispata]|uniref:Uncharacterized protein n=1 Tax=Elysia crispata TaxID=231223 RepID=A0AAE0XNK1_9GAST|nr:hypothetical protein RRG08_062440 [Elysia crispata]
MSVIDTTRLPSQSTQLENFSSAFSFRQVRRFSQHSKISRRKSDNSAVTLLHIDPLEIYRPRHTYEDRARSAVELKLPLKGIVLWRKTRGNN